MTKIWNAIVRQWNKNKWIFPVFIIAVILVLLAVCSSRVGFYQPVAGVEDNATYFALGEKGRYFALFEDDNVGRGYVPRELEDVNEWNTKYKRYANVCYMGDRYLGIGLFHYMVVIDMESDSDGGLKPVSFWKWHNRDSLYTERELKKAMEEDMRDFQKNK